MKRFLDGVAFDPLNAPAAAGQVGTSTSLSDFETKSDWFAVTQARVRKLDGELGIAVLRYDLSDYRARRVAPVALTPEDFLDQWAQMSWDDAMRWTKPSSDTNLQDWHGKLNGIASDSAEMESVRHCSGAAEGDQKWLLQLSID